MRRTGTRAACAVCGGDAGLALRKLPDGSRICRACLASIPAPFLEERYAAAEDARNGAEHGKASIQTLSPMFAATAQYGRMFLDERNGLFTVCDATSVRKDGTLKAPLCGIYPCLAVTEASFSISPVSVSQRAAVCRVTFSGYLGRYNIHIRETLKKSVSCLLVPDGDGMAAWQEPDDLSAFRGCYRQAAETAWRRMRAAEERLKAEERARQEQMSREQEWKERLEKQAARKAMDGQDKVRDARILFMLGDDYTEAELKRQRAALMWAFHPDNGHVPDPAYAQKVNDAYNLLLRRFTEDRL